MSRPKRKSVPNKKQVFIIHGRDMNTVRDLQNFIRSLGFSIMTFQDLANRSANNFVANVVIDGIKTASAVIALFTPDELAAYYEGRTLSREQSGRRWQARPNVIFEAGVAYGVAKRKTILLTAGADVELFSDLSGVHFIRLDSGSGREDLRKRLNQITKHGDGNRRIRRDRTFLNHIVKRWEFFDELQILEKLANETVVNTSRGWRPILYILEGVVKKNPYADWDYYSAEEFMELVGDVYSPTVAEDTFWSLYMWGFFQPNNIKQWVDADETWEGSVEYCELAPRGRAYLRKLLSQLPASTRI